MKEQCNHERVKRHGNTYICATCGAPQRDLFKAGKRHKYGISERDRRTTQGIVFDSKREMERYQELCTLQSAGGISALELQPRFNFVADITCTGTVGGAFYRWRFSYRGDFKYLERTKMVVEDVKGHETEEFKFKWKVAKACRPDIEWRIVK